MRNKKTFGLMLACIFIVLMLLAVKLKITEYIWENLYLFLIIFAAVLVFLIDYVFACEFYAAAKYKGHCKKKYFWYCFIFTVIGYLLVISLPVISTEEVEAPVEKPAVKGYTSGVMDAPKRKRDQ